MGQRTLRPDFQNESLTDFTVDSNRTKFAQSLDCVATKLGADYPIIFGGQKRLLDAKFPSTSPADPERVIGHFSAAGAAEVDEAVAAADRAFLGWSKTPPDLRARFLLAAAAEVRMRRFELCSWMVYEVGKSWDEADGEVAECADLMEFYALQALRLAGSQTSELAKLPTEATDFFYIPLGVGAVVSPWNFPMALTFGMAAAAVVAGNTVVIKPASTSPASVYHYFRIFEDVGLPSGVMNLVTGPGSLVGDALVDHPRTRFIAFTGSKEVGIRIFERAAKVQPGQIWLKRTTLEMGGKNAVIVDCEANLELAAEAVVVSAFSFQGQKCSAGSRAIIDSSIYDDFVSLLVEKAKRLRVGDTVQPEYQMGPVIDARAHKSNCRYVEIGKTEGDLLLGGYPIESKGYFVPPTIFGRVSPKAIIAQQEIFGPVLACIPAKNFDEALEIANGTEFGLTGSVFSRNRTKLERARAEFHTGNLYFNRKSTGALMGVHPFGGFNMSGTDSKAGGSDYLLQFLQGKSIGDKLF
jgi:1-pyrroline-5-carboxylate dehydrogenase